MRQATKHQLQADNDQLRRDQAALLICMAALVDGNVQWFGGSGAHRLGLVRPESPTGGWVIHTLRTSGASTVECRLLDEFDTATRQMLGVALDQQEAYRLRALVCKALVARYEATHNESQTA